MARPTKLDSQVAGRICHHTRLGNYPEVSAAFVGIARSTFLLWLRDAGRIDEKIATAMRLTPRAVGYVEYHRWLDNIDEWLAHLGWVPDPARTVRETGTNRILAQFDRNGDPRPPQPVTFRVLPTTDPRWPAPWLAFSDAVSRAEAEAEMRRVALVNAGAAQDWRAAAFQLERMYPRRWGARSRVELSDPDGNALPAATPPASSVVWHIPWNGRDPLPPGTTDLHPYLPPPPPADDELGGDEADHV
jgi:hypothetical protein